MFSDYQKDILSKLHSGELTKSQFNTLRSDARRYNKLERSIQLATLYEIYKYEVKYGEVPKETYDLTTKQQVLYDMLSHFKEIHNRQNKALMENGDGKYTSPFEHISVQEIKDYALELEGWDKF